MSARTPGGGPAQREAGRRAQLLARWTQSQARLQALWSAIACGTAERFAARAGTAPGGFALHEARRLYDSWIDCAEEAYAAVAHEDEYCRAQAELINTTIALLPERGQLPPLPPQVHGSTLGCSLKEPVWKQDKVVLYRYLPLPFVQAARAQPVLICYALVNRPSVLDLQPDRSLVRSLLAAGLEVYLIDWGYPEDSDRSLALSDYVDRYLGACVEQVLQANRAPALNLLGICQGGTLSLCYSALYPRRVANLVLLATPVDFHTADNLLSKWARYLDTQLLIAAGNVSGAMLTGMFLALSPFRLTHQKYVALLDQLSDPRALELFARMEQWIFDSPDQPATAAGQFIRWLYQENRLVNGSLKLGSKAVNLGRIRQPVLNIYATQDHIVPPSATTVLGRYLGGRDYTEYPVDAGHIGLYVSRQAGQSVPLRISSWLRERS
jgi:polyhydroxyalkanoate synthase